MIFHTENFQDSTKQTEKLLELTHKSVEVEG